MRPNTATLRGRRLSAALVAVLAAGVLAGCTSGGSSTEKVSAGSGTGSCEKGSSPVLTLAAYSNVYDVYGKLTSAFAQDWSDKHDVTPIFQMSFGGSTTQAENIVAGFGADVYASSLDPDVGLVQKEGLITHNWQNQPDHSIVATSLVGFMVRPGNPKGIHDWSDLVRPGLKILTPDPAQSGGARWNIAAAYGAVMRGEVKGYKPTQHDAQRYLQALFKNVTVMDKSANDSFKNFEAGNGDVALTYENQALAGIAAGSEDKFVIPPSTISIQTPTVVVDANAKRHCVESIANQFVSYLHTRDAKDVFTTVGYERPVKVAKAAKGDGKDFPAIKDLFTSDDIGGWTKMSNDTVFGPHGAFTTAFKAAHS